MKRGGRRRPTAPLRVETMASPGGAGIINFCPQCGKKVEATFVFCPSCGSRLPAQEEEEAMQITPAPSVQELNQKDLDKLTVAVKYPAKKKVEIYLPDKGKASTSVKEGSGQNSVASRSPKEATKAKSSSRSPKKNKIASVTPFPEGEILTDQSDKQWKLVKLLSQSDFGLMYEAESASGACHQKQRFSLKLDTKDGRVFNEQNFLQRAAKKVTVEKWKKQHSVPLLGIPNCVGFGLHGSNYRFLVFSNLGRSLQSVLDDGASRLTEKAAYQIAIRLLDVLEFLHENEYCHGDITAENIYVNPMDLSELTLAGYGFAFRYCPGGKHVPQREGSRTPHEGTLEFISLDSHKGAAPSRRSDLESLGYCLVKWLRGFLPWSEELTNPCEVMEKKERYKADIIKNRKPFCGGRAIPDAVLHYLLQVVALDYEERPDYEELRMFLRKPLEAMRASAYDSVDLQVVP
ncbi:PREDICTED: inactive serine/threonine-protein kinase VRK3 [Gekko japonicus]|uniref:Inactive serine/threonine-protein kinase VRK3 n=1 Tax=Gekko japonicus TaxID=146911 RepID=A0ABM1KZE2_GEKJA|nr:PREDICTED: inactive serine/threonine-protein kinase VRK3 [Gekko japonicus]